MNIEKFLNINNWKLSTVRIWRGKVARKKYACYIEEDPYLSIHFLTTGNLFTNSVEVSDLIEAECHKVINEDFLYFDETENLHDKLKTKLKIWKENYQRNNFIFQMEDLPSLNQMFL